MVRRTRTALSSSRNRSSTTTTPTPPPTLPTTASMYNDEYLLDLEDRGVQVIRSPNIFPWGDLSCDSLLQPIRIQPPYLYPSVSHFIYSEIAAHDNLARQSLVNLRSLTPMKREALSLYDRKLFNIIQDALYIAYQALLNSQQNLPIDILIDISEKIDLRFQDQFIPELDRMYPLHSRAKSVHVNAWARFDILNPVIATIRELARQYSNELLLQGYNFDDAYTFDNPVVITSSINDPRRLWHPYTQLDTPLILTNGLEFPSIISFIHFSIIQYISEDSNTNRVYTLTQKVDIGEINIIQLEHELWVERIRTILPEALQIKFRNTYLRRLLISTSSEVLVIEHDWLGAAITEAQSTVLVNIRNKILSSDNIEPFQIYRTVALYNIPRVEEWIRTIRLPNLINTFVIIQNYLNVPFHTSVIEDTLDWLYFVCPDNSDTPVETYPLRFFETLQQIVPKEMFQLWTSSDQNRSIYLIWQMISHIMKLAHYHARRHFNGNYTEMFETLQNQIPQTLSWIDTYIALRTCLYSIIRLHRSVYARIEFKEATWNCVLDILQLEHKTLQQIRNSLELELELDDTTILLRQRIFNDVERMYPNFKSVQTERVTETLFIWSLYLTDLYPTLSDKTRSTIFLFTEPSRHPK